MHRQGNIRKDYNAESVVISFADNSNSKTSRSDTSYPFTLLDVTATMPCCTTYRSATCALLLLWAAATAFTVGLFRR
jgi:hypothetical protein